MSSKRGRRRVSRGLARAAVAMAAGAVGSFAFPPVGVWILAAVSVGALIGALSGAGSFQGFCAATAFGIGLFGPMLAWAATAAGTLEWAALVVASALLVGLLGLAWGVIRQIGWISRHSPVQAAVFAALWTGVEELRAIVPFGGFPWGRLAFSQADSPLGRLAWAGGAPLASFAVALLGALMWTLARHAAQGQTWAAAGAALVAVGIVGAPLAIGLDSRPQQGAITVGAVQGNVPPPGEMKRAQEIRQVFANHLSGTARLANQAGGPVDVVVWPEDSAGRDPQTSSLEGDELTEASLKVGAPILLGAQEYPESGGRFNVSLLWDGRADGAIGRYAKRHPVPFGEYMPMKWLTNTLSKAARGVTTDMIAGEKVGLIDIPKAEGGVPVGVAICFEVVYDRLVGDLARAGAQILVVQTNNASFGRGGEAAQQLAVSRMRAIEHGRAVVHVSTTGVSALVSPAGRIIAETGSWEPGIMIATLPLRSSLTPAARTSGAISWTLLIGGAAMTLGAVWRAVARRKDSR